MTDNFKYNDLDKFRLDYCFTYIDVGARWGAKSDLLQCFPNSRWVGFEPDVEEYSSVNSKKKSGYECFPYALSDKPGTGNLNITKSPDWSSLLEPDSEIFNQFNGLEDFYQITGKQKVPLTTLDELASSHRDLLENADYLKLDAQGGEESVLHGSQTLLSSSLLGVEVEVEFLPLYKEQSLFDQIHKMMIDMDFLLFDMSRNRCIRSNFIPDIETRGQLIWSDAIYLKDFQGLIAKNSTDKLLALILTAMELGFLDYSLTISQAMLEKKIINHGFHLQVCQALEKIRINQRQKTRVVDAIAKLPFGRKLLKYFREFIDGNYDRIVRLSYPEYYFKRD